VSIRVIFPGCIPIALSIGLATGQLGCKRAAVDQARPAAPAVTPDAAPAAPPTIDSVVFITVDALRADQPWTGYDLASTPNLSRLASESVVYDHAYSAANITTPSISGMLASRYPSELARDKCVFGRFDLEGSLVPTLKAAGIATTAAHGHALFAGSTAPSVGFDQWQLVRGAAGRMQVKGAVTGNDQADLFIAQLQDRPRDGKKHFAWAHFVDPHDIYVKHKLYPPSSKGPRGLYDGEVAYTDAVIGRVLDHLAQADLAKRTAIVLTADHGETFGEHGFTRHGFSLYEDEIRVPLMVRIPSVAPRKITAPRSALDVAPTIAELLGVKPPASWKGVSLLRDLTAPVPGERTVIVDIPENTWNPARRVVVFGSTKVAIAPGAVRVFDLDADPGERSPLTGPAADAAVERAKREVAAIDSVEGTPCMQQAPTDDD
jgi:membrane-anchored protein YejM (alkaline phosphatase superfamily)